MRNCNFDEITPHKAKKLVYENTETIGMMITAGLSAMQQVATLSSFALGLKPETVEILSLAAFVTIDASRKDKGQEGIPPHIITAVEEYLNGEPPQKQLLAEPPAAAQDTPG